jgi:3-methyladenine DNA glycosylase AlkD
MNVIALAERIERDLRETATPERAVQEKRYLKSDLEHLGATVPAIRKITIGATRDLDHDQTLALVTELWESNIHELRMAAVETLIHNVKLLASSDLPVAEHLIRDSLSWVYVDALALKVVGGLVVRDPSLATTLDKWITDENFWIRRTAILALLPAFRTGGGDLDRLSAYGDLVLTEKEFFIRKALGWALREVVKTNPAWVIDWVTPRIPQISGVTIREATRNLPEPTATRLMTAYRTR